MHLLAVSGQNIAISAIGVVAVARVAGVGRLVGEGVAIVVVLAYALAVGWQPSVVRAAVAGVLASLAWLVARPRDRWHALALGALVLLAWMPASVLEPGFQLSFAAVAAIFVVAAARRGRSRRAIRCRAAPWDVVVVAVACGVVTAPIVWLHFGAHRALDGARERRRRARDAAADRARRSPPRRSSRSSRAQRRRWPGSPVGAPAWIALVARIVAALAVGAGRLAGRARDRGRRDRAVSRVRRAAARTGARRRRGTALARALRSRCGGGRCAEARPGSRRAGCA